MSRVLIPLPTRGFDPTEASVPWKLLFERGHEIAFATPDGKPASADVREASPDVGWRRAVDLYVDGTLIAWFFEARAPARDAALTFEAGRVGVWLACDQIRSALAQYAASHGSEAGSAAAEEPRTFLGGSPLLLAERLSPWHACVLEAWHKGERRADFVTPRSKK